MVLSYGKLVQKLRGKYKNGYVCARGASMATESARNGAYMRHIFIYAPVAHSNPSVTGDRAHTPIQKIREISKMDPI